MNDDLTTLTVWVALVAIYLCVAYYAGLWPLRTTYKVHILFTHAENFKKDIYDSEEFSNGNQCLLQAHKIAVDIERSGLGAVQAKTCKVIGPFGGWSGFL
jgi:hypothetical protein